MKEVIKTRLGMGAVILLLLLVGTVGVLASQLANAKRDASIAEANNRALVDTVRIFRTDASNAANLFQLQVEFDSDSIAGLNTALGEATRQMDLDHVVITEAVIEIDRLQTSLDSAVTELTNVTNPEGRPERIAAFQFDTTFVQTDVVVVVPWDTAQGIEVEVVTTYKPINIAYSLACTPQHDAVATFESPPGMVIIPRLGMADPTMCHPKSSFFSMDLNLGSFVYAGVGFGLGFGTGWYLGSNSASSTINVELQQRMFTERRVAFSILTVEF